MNSVLLYTLISLGGIGFLLGAILAFAAMRFHVDVDPKIEEVLDILPGANCGGCGYAGCAAFAEAVVTKGADATLCAPGGPHVAKNIAHILGLDVTDTVRRVAYLKCAGTREKAIDKYVMTAGWQRSLPVARKHVNMDALVTAHVLMSANSMHFTWVRMACRLLTAKNVQLAAPAYVNARKTFSNYFRIRQ